MAVGSLLPEPEGRSITCLTVYGIFSGGLSALRVPPGR